VLLALVLLGGKDDADDADDDAIVLLARNSNCTNRNIVLPLVEVVMVDCFGGEYGMKMLSAKPSQNCQPTKYCNL
jgi:hypothetical protein